MTAFYPYLIWASCHHPDLEMPRTLPADMLELIVSFLNLAMVLKFRCCSRRLNDLYRPTRSTQLSDFWLRIRPGINDFQRAVPVMSVNMAKLLMPLYSWLLRVEYSGMIGRIAHRSGNFPLVIWFWEFAISCGKLPTDVGQPCQYFIQACRYGHVDVVAWMLGYNNILPQPQEYAKLNNWCRNNLGRTQRSYLANAAHQGHVTLAEWLIVSGDYVPAERETGMELLAEACINERVEFATWVLTRFPVDISLKKVFEMAENACDCEAHLSVQWLFKTFDITKDHIFKYVGCIPVGMSSDRAAHEWFIGSHTDDPLDD